MQGAGLPPNPVRDDGDAVQVPGEGVSKRGPLPWIVGTVAIAVLAVVALAAILSGDDRVGSEGDAVASALGASGDVSDHDLRMFYGLGEGMTRWNTAALPLITDYLDPTVSAQEWVRDAGTHIDEMRDAQLDMEVNILTIEDSGLRETLRSLTDVLREQTSAVTALRIAVANFDVKGERAALRQLQAAVEERQQIATELLDRLRPHVDPEVLREILQAAAEASG